MPLSEKGCEACAGTIRLLTKDEVNDLLKETPEWLLKDNAIEREFKFKDFREAISFVNEVAELAESEDHHPDIFISYNKVRLELSTHKVGGLSKNDFILAAKVDKLA